MIRDLYRPKTETQRRAPGECAKALIAKMADAMRQRGEGVTREALLDDGFTDAVIKRYGPKAAAQARRRSVRRVA